MRKFFSKNKKIIISFSIILMLAFVFFFYPQITHAAGTAVAKVLGWIIYPFIWIFGKLAILFLDMLIGIAQYNNFIHSSAVTYGWIVVRDLCNMFFVLILLIIAFASILRIESYNLKTWLPKLVIMAVLINFSKLICGLLIDFTQVVMLTFINAIKDIAGTNLTDMLGISKILTASKENGGDITAMSIIGSMILALVIVIIATVVILTMLVMLVMRMIMIWIYVVLSPLAYLLASFPQGQQYSQRWWSDFSKNLIIGPVLAFFLWLSFASLGGLNSKKDIDDMKKNNSFSESLDSGATSSAEIAAASTEAGSKDNMILFVVSIGMLLGGMMIAQEMGGQAGKIVGKGMGKLQAMGAGSLKMGKRVTSSIGRRSAEVGLKGAGAVAGGKKTQVGSFLKSWGQDMGEARSKRAVKGRQNVMESMGMGKRAGQAGKELTNTIKTALNVGDKKGKEKVDEGNKKIIEGEIDLKLAGNLESAQNNYDQLDQRVNLLAMQGGIGTPEYVAASNSRDEAGQDLKEFRRNANISENATKQETMDTATQLRANGQTKIDEGNSSVESGNKKLGGFGKFGTFLIGYTNKAFKKMSEDYEKADNFTKNLSSGTPSMSEIESTKFSKLDNSIDTEQKAVWDNLNSDKHNGAAANLNDVVKKTLFDANGGAKSISDSNKGKMNSIGRGLKTYESSGVKLSPELKKLKDLLNDYARKSGGEIKSVDEHKAGSYRISGVDKESRGMDVNESGIGSINEFGRDKGKSDTISYNFDKLKAKGIDIETASEGAYLEGDMKEKVKVEIISDIDKELNELKSRISSGEELPPKDTRRMDILKTSKSKLEKGDNFSLVNANKQMGVSEAVITQRHEGAHQELDEVRKKNNFKPTEGHKFQEEELVEYYGGKAREAKMTHKVADRVVADVIFDGQKAGLSTEEIKVNIDKVVDEYKAARQTEKVSEIIKKESDSAQASPTQAPITQKVEENINNITNINQGGPSRVQPEINIDLEGVKENMKDSFEGIEKGIKNSIKVNKGVAGDIGDLKIRNSIKDRLDTHRWNKKK
ncbi:MAG: DMT family transporter [Patescibacteria group bacterium]|nr:DMT family transporter [Patescibacteria group bacterium]